MRTTLEIENDVLDAARELARQQNTAIGKIISRLARTALTGQNAVETQTSVAGFRPFPARGTIVSNETVNALRDQAGV